jgi:hypothetical protein
MKAEDLMIGDWVCLADGNLPLEERYFKIKYLAILAGVSWVNQGTNAPIGLGDDESLIPVFRDEIYPIPLTSEILEKNGILYEKQSYYYVIEDNKDLECTYYIQQVQDDWAIGVDIGAYDCSIFARIKHVHQLQHTLRLCGIDKEIVI